MWSVLCSTCVATIILGLSISTVFAQTVNNNTNQNYGYTLPRPNIPTGYDEVRASDGTRCRSAVASNGAYLDVGGIGGMDEDGDFLGDGAVYGRVTIPLGQRPNRVDCTSLYQLELQRLQEELALAKAALRNGGSKVPQGGWNNQ